MRQMFCVRDIQPGRIATDATAFLQRHSHIIDTPPGQLPQDPEWGLGLARYLGARVGPGDIPQLQAVARVAHLRDPETVEAEVTITLLAPGRARYQARLFARDGVIAELDQEVSADPVASL